MNENRRQETPTTQETLPPGEVPVFEKLAPILQANRFALSTSLDGSYKIRTEQGDEFMRGESLAAIQQQVDERIAFAKEAKRLCNEKGYTFIQPYPMLMKPPFNWEIFVSPQHVEHLHALGKRESELTHEEWLEYQDLPNAFTGHPSVKVFVGQPAEILNWIQNAPEAWRLLRSNSLESGCYIEEFTFPLDDNRCSWKKGSSEHTGNEQAVLTIEYSDRRLHVWLRNEWLSAEDKQTPLVTVLSSNGQVKCEGRTKSCYVPIAFETVDLQKGDKIVIDCDQPKKGRHFIITQTL